MHAGSPAPASNGEERQGPHADEEAHFDDPEPVEDPELEVPQHAALRRAQLRPRVVVESRRRASAGRVLESSGGCRHGAAFDEWPLAHTELESSSCVAWSCTQWILSRWLRGFAGSLVVDCIGPAWAMTSTGSLAGISTLKSSGTSLAPGANSTADDLGNSLQCSR
ncbi:unnamed protein product [Phytophthora fragariaefolia]|uniref:Unnamed protein product n=1 Tax=Phytophthora fragariaefolia TaxID=1490495 RepID=A0A9W7D1B3_9STRA|nr:unnamed protein product [Phytophthora fragariaefolia]